jgi:hypothetical protein
MGCPVLAGASTSFHAVACHLPSYYPKVTLQSYRLTGRRYIDSSPKANISAPFIAPTIGTTTSLHQPSLAHHIEWPTTPNPGVQSSSTQYRHTRPTFLNHQQRPTRRRATSGSAPRPRPYRHSRPCTPRPRHTAQTRTSSPRSAKRTLHSSSSQLVGWQRGLSRPAAQVHSSTFPRQTSARGA